jgi:hypothetical protein
MFKYKNTLLHGLLFASLMVFPIAGFSEGTSSSGGTSTMMPTEKTTPMNPTMKGSDEMSHSGGSGISASGTTLGWYYYGRPYWYRPYYYYGNDYSYYPYYYNYNYYPYRPYYSHNFNRFGGFHGGFHGGGFHGRR